MTDDPVAHPGECRVDGRQLTADLRSLGLRRGQSLLIHCSLRRVGPIEGGAAALLAAILDVAGPEATITVPTHTSSNSLTSAAFRAATSGFGPAERARYIETMPGFDPVATPSHGMGAFAEYVRLHPLARRSGHPQVSFAAFGPGAIACTAIHDLDCHLGDRSPLMWLYQTDAAILLLGVGYSACTAFHLAEYRLPRKPARQFYQCFTSHAGERTRRTFTDLALDDTDFESLGADLEVAASTVAPALRRGKVGMAESRLVPFRAAVDFAVKWLGAHRELSQS